MPFAFSKDLFVAEDGAPMHFDLSRCEEAQELSEYVERGGGLVDQNPGPFSIIIVDAPEDTSVVTAEESFKSDFILQCCRQNRIVQLSRYRWNSASHYRAEFNPNDVLQHKISWENARKQFKRIQDDSVSEISSVSIDETQHRLTNSVGPRAFSKSSRSEFTHSERKQMVEYIVKAKAFNEITGTALWKRMEPDINNHTWQSLKEHFLKKVIPFIQTYNLSPDIVQQFRYAVKTKSTRQGGRASYQKPSAVPGGTWQSAGKKYDPFQKNKTQSSVKSAVPDEPIAASADLFADTPQQQATPAIETAANSQDDSSQDSKAERVVFVSDCEDESTSDSEGMNEDNNKRLADISKPDSTHSGSNATPTAVLSTLQIKRIKPQPDSTHSGEKRKWTESSDQPSTSSQNLPCTFLPSNYQNSFDETGCTQNSVASFNAAEQGNSQSNLSVTAVTGSNSQQLIMEVDTSEESDVPDNGQILPIDAVSRNREVAVKAAAPTRDVAVQTDPVLILPAGWEFAMGDVFVSSEPSPPPSPLHFPQPSHDGCPSPVPGNSPFLDCSKDL